MHRGGLRPHPHGGQKPSQPCQARVTLTLTLVRKKTFSLHFLEEIPVGDDLQLLKDKENTTADEEGLVLRQGLVQEQKVAFAGGGRAGNAQTWSKKPKARQGTWEIFN